MCTSPAAIGLISGDSRTLDAVADQPELAEPVLRSSGSSARSQ
jgi:hypothetical protein